MGSVRRESGNRPSVGPSRAATYARSMSGETSEPAPGLGQTVALYAAARLAVVAVVSMLLVLAGVPLLVALLVGIVVALPLSMVLFRGLRARLDAAVAASGARRSAEREALRARLRGESE